MNKKLKKGFTLIEMLVVVTIIGIVSTILYSSYTRYVRVTKFTAATAEFKEIISCFETAMVSNSMSGRTEGAEINFETFQHFDELMKLDLKEAYEYISPNVLPASAVLTVEDKKIHYINNGIETVYDPAKREIVSQSVY